jgi:hypothetical protein
MKKIFSFLLTVATTLVIATSCADIPMPYELIDENPSEKIEAAGDGTKDNPFNVAGIIKYTKGLEADKNSDKEVYFTGIICDDPNVDTGQYGNATFKISDDGTDNNTFYIFRAFDINNAKFTTKNIKKGDKVVICGTVVNYKGNTPETAANKAYLVSINTGGSTGTSEGVTIDGTTVTLANSAATAGEETITVDLNTLGFKNDSVIAEVTLSDGSKVIFDKGKNSNAPKFYEKTKGIRVYANNTITFAGKSAIAKIVITCDEYNGTKYVGNATATVAFDGNNAVYTNAIASGSGVQLRVQTITITYAK